MIQCPTICNFYLLYRGFLQFLGHLKTTSNKASSFPGEAFFIPIPEVKVNQSYSSGVVGGAKKYSFPQETTSGGILTGHIQRCLYTTKAIEHSASIPKYNGLCFKSRSIKAAPRVGMLPINLIIREK